MRPERISDPRIMRLLAEKSRRNGKRIALVPTMGYLHAGHLSLLEEGRRRSDVLVLSIFVNPTQFGPREDLARYPRDLEGDLEKARGKGVDIAFVPDVKDMYSPGYQTYVEVRELSEGLCGKRRPGHFAGVASVVTKLFNIVTPHLAVFGEKDFQQLAVIRRLVEDLSYEIEIVGMPIVRESDGLAMSSRNAYLSAKERQEATALSRALGHARALVRTGVTDATLLIKSVLELLLAVPSLRVDYVELRDAESLRPAAEVDRKSVLAVAAFLGKTRLIDNCVLERPHVS